MPKLKHNCKECNKVFYVFPSLDRVKFCSRKCYEKVWARTIPQLNKGKKLSQKHKIKLSNARKGKYIGDLNHQWKGSKAGISAFHYRVYFRRGKADCCEVCNKNDNSKKYDWANLTGKYDDINDYKKICISCHRKYDYKRRKNAIRYESRKRAESKKTIR